MVNFRLSEETAALRATVAAFARDVVAPVSARHDAEKSFPYDVVRGMAAMGLFGLPLPAEYDGMGGDLLALCVAVEELARVDASVAITLEAGACLGAVPLLRFGSADQRARWLPPLARGEMLGAFALTEPGGGSDPAAIRTSARLDGDAWVLNGSKAFITNSGTDLTGFVLVVARTGGPGDPTGPDGLRDLSMILVPRPAPGLSIGPAYAKVGWRASDTHEVSFADCRVPATNLVGERGRGYAQALAALDEGRVALAAMAVGMAQGCLDESLRYARSREAFGRRLADHQAIAFKLADMEMRAHTARLAYYDAADRCLRGEPFKRQASVAKLHASEAAVANARDATQIHGGSGFMEEFPVARMWRDCKALEIGEGTSEVQRMLISRDLLGG